MDEAKQRIAIAEACGWRIEENKDGTAHAYRPGKLDIGCGYAGFGKLTKEFQEFLPDYLNDLNAMQKVWELLEPYQKAKLACNLNEIMGLTLQITGWIDLIGATAAQRCEAFLKTIGKWEEASDET